MSQPYDSRALGPDFVHLCGGLSHCGSPVETRCKRGREHTAIPYLCKTFSAALSVQLFAFLFKLFAQRAKCCKRLCIFVTHWGDAGLGKRGGAQFRSGGARIKR